MSPIDFSVWPLVWWARASWDLSPEKLCAMENVKSSFRNQPGESQNREIMSTETLLQLLQIFTFQLQVTSDRSKHPWYTTKQIQTWQNEATFNQCLTPSFHSCLLSTITTRTIRWPYQLPAMKCKCSSLLTTMDTGGVERFASRNYLEGQTVDK
jgi:hypothetical protein